MHSWIFSLNQRYEDSNEYIESLSLISNAEDCENDTNKEPSAEYSADYFLIYDQSYKIYFQRLRLLFSCKIKISFIYYSMLKNLDAPLKLHVAVVFFFVSMVSNPKHEIWTTVKPESKPHVSYLTEY